MLWLESDLAVPAQPYLDAYADMRPAQAFAFDADGAAAAAQAILPAFSLSETAVNAGPAHRAAAAAAVAATLAQRRVAKPPHAQPAAGAGAAVKPATAKPAHQPAAALPPALLSAAKARAAAAAHARAAAAAQSPPAGAGARAAPARTQALSAARRTIHLGEKFRRGGPAGGPAEGGGTAALAARDPERDAEREAAVQRLTLKHATLQGIKDEGKDRQAGRGPSDEDSAEVRVPGGPGEQHRAKLDKKIEAYHGVLAKAVMVLAFMAVGAMVSGVVGVVYCWRRDSNLVDPKDRALGEEARAKGKHFGRSTPQYGSYGNARGRR